MTAEINNLASLNASAISGAYKSYRQNFEKLASGSRLNRASDGAAELAVTNLLKADLVSIDHGIKNVRDGISMLQISDGSMEAVSQNLIRMKELAAQAGSDVYSPAQKKLLQQEFDNLASQNAQIAEMANFNGIRLHKDNQTISIMAEGERVAAIKTKSIPMLAIDLGDPEVSLSAISDEINNINSYRASLGSHMNTLENHASVLLNKAEEILKSESRIADTDIASTAASLAADEIVTKQAVAVQVHAQTISQIAGTLL